MKLILKLNVILFLLAGSLNSCEKKEKSDHEDNEIFYYNFDEKIFLKQVKSKIFLKFTPDANEEQLNALIGSESSLRPTSDISLDGNAGLRFAVLEARNGKQIQSTTIEYFKTKVEVISVEYLSMYNDFLQGLTDVITVKLKETTTHAQLQELAEQNHCTVREENQYVKNEFMLFVSKVSESNAMHTANLFYETGFFEFASASLILLNLSVFIPDNEFYYYVSGEKIFLEQVKDKIHFKFTPEASKEQLLALISSDVSLQPIPLFSFLNEEYHHIRYAALESKDGSHIPLATIESFKTKEEVVSAEYMYLYDGRTLVGLNDRISVRLNETATYAQLQGLAEQYNCTIGEGNRFVKNQFMLYVSKTSNLNAMQIGNFFYETTGLFERSSPSLFSLVMAD